MHRPFPAISLTPCLLTALVLACVGDEPAATAPGPTGSDAAAGADAPAIDTSDGGADASASDAAAPPCDTTKPFGAPLLVPGVNTAEDDSSPSLAADEKTIFLTRLNATDFDVYVATRTDRFGAFGDAELVPGVNVPSFDGDPLVSYDGKLFFMSSVRSAPGTVGGADMFVASRDPVTGVIGALAPIPGLNSTANDGQGYLTSGTEMIFVSARADAGAPVNLYRGRFEDGGVTDVSAIAELTTPFAESNPVLSPDGETLYFATDRTDAVPSSTQTNIWSAERMPSGSFGSPAPVPELNSASKDYPKWISPDGCRLYLQSDRPGVGKLDIYVAERPKR
jgi:Tol biopolymer transport system component